MGSVFKREFHWHLLDCVLYPEVTCSRCVSFRTRSQKCKWHSHVLDLLISKAIQRGDKSLVPMRELSK